jgi:hypothetical protein
MDTGLFYKTEIGTFQNTDDRNTIDEIRNFVLDNYVTILQYRPSFHEYIKFSPEILQLLVDKLRNSEQLKSSICSQYKNCDITSLDNTDELYISHYNIDGGGDQGLFEKHYDGVLRFINNASVVRVLIYINSNDDYVVHFEDSNISHRFENYEYGILDFNKEYHWVEGTYNKNMDYKDSRILLKINYLVCPKCSNWYKEFLIFINVYIFYLVKMCMEYSKSPQTPFQYVIGFVCNLFRVVNNISVYFTFVLSIFLLLTLYILFYYAFKYIKYIVNIKNIKRNTRIKV